MAWQARVELGFADNIDAGQQKIGIHHPVQLNAGIDHANNYGVSIVQVGRIQFEPGKGIPADWLNGFRVGGFPLGFWFAQQGAIIVFVLLVLIYALLLNRLDKRHHEELARIHRGETGP